MHAGKMCLSAIDTSTNVHTKLKDESFAQQTFGSLEQQAMGKSEKHTASTKLVCGLPANEL